MSEKSEEIQEAATRAVRREGFASLSFRTLAEQVGVKSSSVHYHFPTKPDLGLAMVQRYAADFRGRLDTIRANHEGLADRLEAFIALFTEGVRTGEFCLCGMMAAEAATLDAATRSALARFFAHCEGWVAQVVAEAPERARLPLAPEAFARMLMAGLEGASLIDRLEGSPVRLDAWRSWVRALVA